MTPHATKGVSDDHHDQAHRTFRRTRLYPEEIFAWGRELGCKEAWLGTELDNEAANALYRGFHPEEDYAIRYYLFNL